MYRLLGSSHTEFFAIALAMQKSRIPTLSEVHYNLLSLSLKVQCERNLKLLIAFMCTWGKERTISQCNFKRVPHCIPGLFDAVIAARDPPQTAIACIGLFGEIEQPGFLFHVQVIVSRAFAWLQEIIPKMHFFWNRLTKIFSGGSTISKRVGVDPLGGKVNLSFLPFSPKIAGN